MLKYEFSWSFLRYKLFRKCKRAYFFHYYASWNGWKQYADELAKKAYFLKNLKKSGHWIENIFRNSLFESLENGDENLTEIENYAYSHLKKQIFESRNPLNEYEPQKIVFFDNYYNIKNISEIEKNAGIQLSLIFENFKKIRNYIADIPYLKLKKFKRPASFRLDGLKIWCSPDLIFENTGRTVILNLFFRNPADYGDWAVKSTIDSIFAEYKWRGREIENKSIFLHEKSFPLITVSRNRREIISIIKRSSNEMLSLTDMDTKIIREPFNKVNDLNICNSCVYKELCGVELPSC